MTYKNPTANSPTKDSSANLVARVGFILSLIGILGVFMAGPLADFGSDLGVHLAFLCMPGLIISFFGVFSVPSQLTKWGIGLGLWGSFYLPTFYLTLFVFPYN